MRSCVILIVACLVLSIAPASRSQTAPSGQDLERENARLREEVARLRNEVRELQEKLHQVPGWQRPSTQPFNFRFNLPRTIPIPAYPQRPAEPGERREFNGQPYYLIPLETER